MKKIFALALLAFFTLTAHALIPQTSTRMWNKQGLTGYIYPSFAAVVADDDAGAKASNPACQWITEVHTETATEGGYYIRSLTNCGQVNRWSTSEVTLSCPANSTLQGAGQCACNSGFTEQGSACVQVTCDTWRDSLNGAGMPLVGTGTARIESCFQGCKLRGSGGTGWTDKTTGVKHFEVYGPFTTAGTCSATPETGGGSPVEPPATPSPADCKGYWGNVNGVDKCIPKAPTIGDGVATNNDKTTTTTDGTGTTTTTQKGETTCDAGTCTTTKEVTVTGPSGVPVTTTTTSTAPVQSFCAENPTASACAAYDQCKDNPDSLACMQLGTPTNGSGLPQLDSGFSSITAVAFSESAGCPAPLAFTVRGTAHTISYQPVCDGAASYIKPVVLVLAAALAAFIFVGGFKT